LADGASESWGRRALFDVDRKLAAKGEILGFFTCELLGPDFLENILDLTSIKFSFDQVPQ
jgi:hypothetical protein